MIEQLDIMAIAPHPDDLEIICGGTLAKLVLQGYKVGIIDLTSGEPTPRGSEELRRQEAEAARQILGVQLRLNLNLPNRILMDTPENRFIVATAIRRYRPALIIAAAGRTPAASPDHHQGHLLIEASRFYSQLTKWDDRFEFTLPYRVPHLVYAPFPFDAEQRQWHSQFIVDISETFEQKLTSIRAYGSQFDSNRFDKVKHLITGNAISLGGRCGFMYGELFALPHPVGTTDLLKLVKSNHSFSPHAEPIIEPGKDHLPMN